MSSALVDENDLASLMAAHRSRRTASPARGNAMASRRSAERRATAKPIADNDGRRLRSTGRTEQLGVRITPETKDRLARIAANKSMTIASIIEDALAVYEQYGDTP